MLTESPLALEWELFQGMRTRHGPPTMTKSCRTPRRRAALLEGHGPELARCFEFWICGEDVEAKKPNPEGYEQALRRLQLPASQVLALEDSPQGLAAAMDAGLACLLTLGEPPGSSEPRWWQRATASLTHLGEEGDPTRVVHGPPCEQAEVTFSWLSRLLEEA